MWVGYWWEIHVERLRGWSLEVEVNYFLEVHIGNFILGSLIWEYEVYDGKLKLGC